MSARPSLKEQNAWIIRGALLMHFAAFAYAAFAPLVREWMARPGAVEELQGLLAPGSLSLAALALVRLVLLGVIPARLRDRLIHWRWRHPLPGARAFTRIGPADPRVDLESMKTRYGPLPAEPAAQDRLFYAVYREHAESTGVLDAHRSYLAARDIGTISFLLWLFLPPLSYWASHDMTRSLIYGALLLGAFGIVALAAQGYGVRFVQNVLAAATAGGDSAMRP